MILNLFSQNDWTFEKFQERYRCKNLIFVNIDIKQKSLSPNNFLYSSQSDRNICRTNAIKSLLRFTESINPQSILYQDASITLLHPSSVRNRRLYGVHMKSENRSRSATTAKSDTVVNNVSRLSRIDDGSARSRIHRETRHG